jgi:ABC-2 type transport system ATP-binding protein
VFGFIGPNGAGKTTTIKMMMGLLAPTSGTVILGGHDIGREPEAAKALTGYLPDRPYLYDKLTASEFLRFVGGLYGIERRELSRRSDELLEQFGLADRAEELVETFSHGMKQRLALATALAHRPSLLVLDEPMVGLDPQGAVALRRLLVELSARGVTIFLSTHSLPVAEELCNRIGILDRGRLVALGNLAELRERAAARPERIHDGGSLESVFLTITGAA